MVVPAGLLEVLAQISEAALVAGGLLSPTTHNDAQLEGPPPTAAPIFSRTSSKYPFMQPRCHRFTFAATCCKYGRLIQPRMTCFLCLSCSLALRNSRLNSQRPRQQTFLSATYFKGRSRCEKIVLRCHYTQHSSG
jgi:hypothetical protein